MLPGPSCPHGFPSEIVDRLIREHGIVIQVSAVELCFTAGSEAQRLTAYAPVHVVIHTPRDSGCRSSNDDFPGMVQKTGMPVTSTN